MIEIVIPKVHVNKSLYIRTAFKSNPIKNIGKTEKHNNINYNKLSQGQGQIFVMNCYIFL